MLSLPLGIQLLVLIQDPFPSLPYKFGLGTAPSDMPFLPESRGPVTVMATSHSPSLPKLAQSRSKADFFKHLGWSEKSEVHKRLYNLMKVHRHPRSLYRVVVLNFDRGVGGGVRGSQGSECRPLSPEQRGQERS